QVEFDVATAAVLLELLLRLAVRLVLATVGDGQIRLEEGVAGVADEVERLLQLAGEVVEEDAADAAGLVAVGQVEVFVARALQLRVIDGVGVLLADGLPGAVEVDDVLTNGVVRRQVGAAAEPAGVAAAEEAEVGMNGGHHRAARVQHERDAGGGEGAALAGGDLFGELLAELAVDVGEVDAGLLEQAALHQPPPPPAAATWALPLVLVEALAVHGLEAGDDALLQAAEVVDRSFAQVHGVWSSSSTPRPARPGASAPGY